MSIDWARVKLLIERSERHSRHPFESEVLTLEEWRELGEASARDRDRYVRTFLEATKKEE